MSALIRELRRVLRRVAARPAFALTSVITLAVGLGGVTAVFAALDAVLLAPLPYPEPERLAGLHHSAPGWGIEKAGISEALYLHYRAHNDVFEDIGVFVENVVTLTDRDEPERIPVAVVTSNVFSVLGVAPLYGRLLTPADALPGRASVVVVSHDLWTRRYGRDPGLVGRSIELNGRMREVVGVMPHGFDFPAPETRVWFALEEPAAATARVRRMDLRAVARLKPGVSAAVAQASLERSIPSIVGGYRDASRDALRDGRLRPFVSSLKDDIVGDVRTPLWIVFGAMAFVLVICWANVATLFLVRAEERQREVALQRALGAHRRRIVGDFLIEGVVLGLLGGALAGGIAWAAATLEFGLARMDVPRLDGARVDWRVGAFALAASLLTGIALAAAGLWHATRGDVSTALRAAANNFAGARRQHRLQRALLALQVAFALAVLIGSGLLIRSFTRLQALDPGFDRTGVLTFRISLPARQYQTYADAAGFFATVLDRLRSLPGVEAASAIAVLPLDAAPSVNQATASAEGQSASPSPVILNYAMPGYFEAMRIPLLEGNPIQPAEVGDEVEPAVLSAAAARSLFGNQSAVGRRIQVTGPSRSGPVRVVGIVGDTVGGTLDAGRIPMVYFLVTTNGVGRLGSRRVPHDNAVLVRAPLPAGSLSAAIREIVRERDPRLPVGAVRTMDQAVAESSARTRVAAILLSLAASAGLFLATVGTFGITAYVVRRRSREIAIRLAMGAPPANLKRMIVRQTAVVLAAGAAIGIAVSTAAGRFMGALIFGLSPHDPLTFACVTALVLLVGVTASYTAARRADQIDPALTLKRE